MVLEYPRTPRTRYHGGLPLHTPLTFSGVVTDGQVNFIRDKFIRIWRRPSAVGIDIGRRAYLDCEGGSSFYPSVIGISLCWQRKCRSFQIRSA